MLIPVPPSECMRAREAASGRLDGELSQIEAVRLDAHLRRCAVCREFASGVAAFTSDLRAAPLERPALLTFEPRRQRVRGLRMHGTAAAAMVLLAAGSVALSHVGGRTTPRSAARISGADAAALHQEAVVQRLLAMLPTPDRLSAEQRGPNQPQ